MSIHPNCSVLLGLILGAPVLAPRPAAALPACHFVLVSQSPGAGATAPAPPRAELPVLGAEEVEIRAREFQYSPETRRHAALGGVTVTQGPTRLTADTMTYDEETGEIVAEGSVVYTEPGRTIRAERVVYNVITRRARAEAAETVVQGIIARAGEVEGDASKITVGRASVTTCDLPRPHYHFTARSVVITPGGRVVARHVGLWLFGTRLLTVPKLEARIGAGRGEQRASPFPRVGTNSRDGFYAQKDFRLVETSRLFLNLDARVSLRRGLFGGLETAAPLGRNLQLIGALKYREEAPNQRSTFLEVDHIPQVGILWVHPVPTAERRPSGAGRVPGSGFRLPGSGQDRPPVNSEPSPPGSQNPEPARRPTVTAAPDYRPLREVGSDAVHQPYLLRPPQAGRWYLRAQSTVGFFHQHATSSEEGSVESATGGRFDVRATAARRGLRIAGVPMPVLQLFVRQSFYDEGLSYAVFGIAADQDWKLGPHWSTRLRAFVHKTWGLTPFEFDRVEIRTELQPGISYQVGDTTLGWIGRWDVDRRQVYDQEYSIARVFHCLEPRFSYRTRRRQFSIDLRIVGLDFE